MAMETITLHIFSSILILLIFVGCSNKKSSSYPLPLAKAIDYFYAENENQQVVAELDSLNNENHPNFIGRIGELFKTAALCEKGESIARLFCSKR